MEIEGRPARDGENLAKDCYYDLWQGWRVDAYEACSSMTILVFRNAVLCLPVRSPPITEETTEKYGGLILLTPTELY